MDIDGLGSVKVRQPFAALVGFYPKDRLELISLLENLLNEANIPEFNGDPLGALAPHAGYQYSGRLAAKVYRAFLGREVELVIIFAPPHRVYRREPTFDAVNYYETPLGRVEVDQSFIEELVSESPLFSVSRQPHIQEHAVEVQLPFLQYVLKPGFKIAPAVVGDLGLDELEKIADVLAKKLKYRNFIIISSSDFSHYYPYDQAMEMDLLGMDAINRFEPELLYKLLITNQVEMCGGYGTVLAMITLKKLGVNLAIDLGYYNSGDVIGTDEARASVVGYGAALFIRKPKIRKLVLEKWLSREEQQELLQLARRTIEEYLSTGRYSEYIPISEKLYQPFGAFVTLQTRDGKLRGCIGHIEADKPLYKVVQEMAIAAATQDPRFPPVTLEELNDLEIEISILSPLRRVKNLSEIEVGKHGLMVKKGFASGLLLPQVAVDWGFNRDEFVRQTLFKAGLDPSDLYSPDLEIYLFTAQVFSESDFV
jgi:AmmeMemoRadiSam system protein B/AmmeMemoRadiSam system protein A